MTDTDAVRAMLEARSVAVVGASARPGSFGARLVTEVLRSASSPTVHLVNPRYAEVAGRPCLDTLADVSGPVDLVLLAVGDAALEKQLRLAADRDDRSAVVFGSAWSPPSAAPPLRDRLAAIARDAGMALCGGGCMGFVDVTRGLRAIGYLERERLPAGPVAFVSHSGSAFSALLRSHRAIGFSLAVSSGQELVTTTADYVDHALRRPDTRVLALFLETVREPQRLRASLERARAQDVPVVLLAVGSTPASASLVAAHSGALAGSDGSWEALTEAHSLLRVDDLDEMADLLEVLAAGRRVPRRGRRRPGTGIATVHDSGAERALVADLAADLAVPFADLGPATRQRLADLLDPGLAPGNPLDVWGTGSATRELFAGALQALADDTHVSALALSVDLVEELDGDDSYPLAVLDVHARTDKPVVVLSNMASALDPSWAQRLRAAGVPVLEGTASGLRALRHLLALGEQVAARGAPPVDAARQERWLTRLARGPLSTSESCELLRDYGIGVVPTESVADRDAAAAAAARLGWPVVLKTDSGAAHKSDVGGVVLGLTDVGGVKTAYDVMSARLGPRVTVSATAPDGVELSVGITTDPLLGPMLVVGAGGVLVELLQDRSVALPPLDEHRATALLDRLRCRPLLDGLRGRPPADLPSVVAAVCAVGQLAVELHEQVSALDVNPLIATADGALAVDVLVLASGPQKIA